MDACASEQNSRLPRFWNQEDDGLSQSWEGVLWCNPPYSNIEPWVCKAYEAALNGCTVVCLLPAWTDRGWFHKYCTHAEIRFIKGRITFGGANNSATFASMLVIFHPIWPVPVMS